jgi:hypothetical protein
VRWRDSVIPVAVAAARARLRASAVRARGTTEQAHASAPRKEEAGEDASARCVSERVVTYQKKTVRAIGG